MKKSFIPTEFKNFSIVKSFMFLIVLSTLSSCIVDVDVDDIRTDSVREFILRNDTNQEIEIYYNPRGSSFDVIYIEPYGETVITTVFDNGLPFAPATSIFEIYFGLDRCLIESRDQDLIWGGRKSGMFYDRNNFDIFRNASNARADETFVYTFTYTDFDKTVVCIDNKKKPSKEKVEKI